MFKKLKISRFIAAFASLLIVMGIMISPLHAQGINVSGNGFTKDGAPWIPYGFSLVAFVAPQGHALSPAFAKARELYGPNLFAQAKSFGGNTLRIQVSQPGLDPESSIYDPAYLKDVIGGIQQARANGFVVIVSMQWEKPSGLDKQYPMPGKMTQRAWATIVPALPVDSNIMLELFNEPGMRPEANPQAWSIWQTGMQTLVSQIRNAGAQNVLILDGLYGSHVLAGAPTINDPLQKLAYAVHPYLNPKGDLDRDNWDGLWGNFAQTHPVMVSEWNATSSDKDNCRADTPEISQKLIEYISQRHIGLLMWALDLPLTLLKADGQPKDFQNFACGSGGGSGAAALAFNLFRSK